MKKIYNANCTTPRGVKFSDHTTNRDWKEKEIQDILLTERFSFVSGARKENPMFAKLRRC